MLSNFALVSTSHILFDQSTYSQHACRNKKSQGKKPFPCERKRARDARGRLDSIKTLACGAESFGCQCPGHVICLRNESMNAHTRVIHNHVFHVNFQRFIYKEGLSRNHPMLKTISINAVYKKKIHTRA